MVTFSPTVQSRASTVASTQRFSSYSEPRLPVGSNEATGMPVGPATSMPLPGIGMLA